MTGQYVVAPTGQVLVKFHCREGGVWAIRDPRPRAIDFGALRNTVTERNITHGAQCQDWNFLRWDKFRPPDFHGARWCCFKLVAVQWIFLARVRGSNIIVMGLL